MLNVLNSYSGFSKLFKEFLEEIQLKVTILCINELAWPPRTKQYIIFKPCYRKHWRLQINTSFVDCSMENFPCRSTQVSKPVLQISRNEVRSSEDRMWKTVSFRTWRKDIRRKAISCAEESFLAGFHLYTGCLQQL